MPDRHVLPVTQQQRIHSGIKDLEIIGRDGDNREVPFVAHQKLEEYWESGDRIKAVLCHLDRAPPVRTIFAKYLRVFTILVVLNKIEYITAFTSYGLTDDYWPQHYSFPGWPDTSEYRDLFENFHRTQWTYFPLEFDRHGLINQIIPRQRILPIQRIVPVVPKSGPRDVGDVNVSMIVIHESCNRFFDKSSRKTNTFLLKAYSLQDGEPENEYHRENDAYSLMESSGPSDNVVRFYGSFQQNGTGSLVMEYIQGGNLLEYLREDHYPQTLGDIHDFWFSISGLLKGLAKVHQVTEGASESARRAVIHQDLKLDNFLVSRSTVSRFKFLVKLADFGHSSVATAQDDGSVLTAPNSRGNATTRSPETANHYSALRYGANIVTRALDIWAMGCHLLQIAAWVPEGYENVETFSDMRYDELATYPRFHGSGHVHSFHNGADPLQSINDEYRLILNQLSERNNMDKVTPAILNIVIKHMLTKEPNNRLDAQQVWHNIDNILNQLKPDQSEDKQKQQSKSHNQRHVQPHTRNGSLASSVLQRRLTVDQCVEFREARKSQMRPDAGVCSTIDWLKESLGVRDYLFLIEDSPSLSLHIEDLKRVFTGVSYVAHQLDPNGIELAFISSPSKVHKKRSTTNLINIVKSHRYDHDAGLMEDKLGTFLEKIVEPKLPHPLARHLPYSSSRPLTVFIFTDGCWGQGLAYAAGVQNPIRELMDTMKDRKINRTNVTIQFIRFGDDVDGKRYLKYLDNMGQEEKRLVCEPGHLDFEPDQGFR